jgi:hypothetical protein
MAMGKEIQCLIGAHATRGKAYVAHLPLWFPAGDTPHDLSQCEFAPFTELRTYNKYWGALGYVPKSLRKALDYFGVVDKKSLITKLAHRIAAGAFDRWGARCEAVADGVVRKESTIVARELVDRGIG